MHFTTSENGATFPGFDKKSQLNLSLGLLRMCCKKKGVFLKK